MSAARTTSSGLLYHYTNTVTQIDVVVKPCGLESDVGLEAAAPSGRTGRLFLVVVQLGGSTTAR